MVKNDQLKFNIFSFISTFARSLIEIFISLYLFKNGYSIQNIVMFYLFVNLFAIPLSYIFVKIGEKTRYSYVMIIGLVSFLVVQLLLRNIVKSNGYLLLISLIYSMYRRGYWVSRRFYITKIMPTKKTSGLFSIVLVTSQIASIAAGYVGSFILSNIDFLRLTIISSTLLFLSVIPLFNIKYSNDSKEIKLRENLKKYDKNNFLVFSFYELNNLVSFIFPIYIALYVNNSYSLAGSLNAVSNVAIILFILVYGKIINKDKNYLIMSTMLLIVCLALKLSITNYAIIVVYFWEGLLSKMQNQSVNKIYFENRKDMDLTHYNLIYQITECFVRAIVAIPLVFIADIRVMIMFVIFTIFILQLIYIFSIGKIENKKLNNEQVKA